MRLDGAFVQHTRRVKALRGEVVRNAVNMPAVDAQTLKVLRPYLTLAGRLGSALQQISPAPIERLRRRVKSRV